MRYCKDMYLNLNEDRSSRKHMGGLQDDTMQDARLHRRLFALGYGGQPYIKIRKHTIEPMQYVKGLENHHEEMRYH